MNLEEKYDKSVHPVKNMKERFEQSELSLEELEQFRDENGFIDLSKAGIFLTDKSKEYIGNQERIKNWVDFAGTKAMIKGEALFEGEENYGIYAELIIEELAKKMGIPAAHYDLVKIQDENGNVVPGVLSVSMVDRDKDERLESLHAIIGDEPNNPKQQSDTTSFEFTINKLRDNLEKQGFNKQTIDDLLLDYKKRTAFFIRTADADKHIENIAFIRGKDEDGNQTIRLSPVFDSESALLMDISKSTIDKLMDDGIALLQTVGGIYPRVCVCKTKNEGGLEEPWADTMELLIEDDELYDYINDVLNAPVDMDEILDSVEDRIKAKLPNKVREITKAAFNFRGDEMEQVMDGSYLELHESSKKTGNPLLESLINKSEKSDITTTDFSSLFETLGLKMNFGNQSRDKDEDNKELDDY